MRILISLLAIILIAGVAHAQSQQYICPMHPHYHSDAPGSCPICGMDLVAAAPAETSTSGNDTSSLHGHGAPSAITVAPEIIQNMGVRTEKARITPFGKRVRSYGIVTINERLQKKIYSRVDGWISKLNVSAIGDEVQEGAPLYSIHSPELLLAQHDLLALERSGRNIDLGKLFTHYEVDKAFVRELRKTGRVRETVPYYSPYSGTVSDLLVREGSHVSTEIPLMVIDDYSKLWIEASVAEKDLGLLDKTSTARISFPNMGGEPERTASIDYIYPTIDPDTRTGKIRLMIDNHDDRLKPGAYADITFTASSGERLNIPSEAILKSMDGDFVVIALGEGRFQPRQIHTGVASDGRTEVLHGLSEGEEIVVSGQFLIDSESSMRDAFRKMETPAGGSHAGH